MGLIRSLGIYLYAGILVIGTYFKLQKAKRLFQQESNPSINEKIFSEPKNVSQKVIKRTGSQVIVKGNEKLPNEAVLFVSNHQGLFDILAFLGYLGKPVGFIAKKEIQKLPIIRSWMKLIHCVFLDRSDRRQSIKAINRGITFLKEGHSMVIFPEGTRSRDRTLNPFKPGSLRLATKANVPIVPVAIDGTYQILEKGNGRDIRSSTITITIHDPIYPTSYKGQKNTELAANLQEIIQTTLDQNKGSIPHDQVTIH
ncbi:lysophospholipid acyltransferase family protein [Oceanobacillus halotolerans]|uniref:lysophospholipid acyltransferase family protein n=1 Tax=Oceanobacillus halotolerans TaxID=2663380 RepID=UPI001CF79BAD|nr:lysophospholipid acyltransferase family protein [Oceanobacillus halotolerans]